MKRCFACFLLLLSLAITRNGHGSEALLQELQSAASALQLVPNIRWEFLSDKGLRSVYVANEDRWRIDVYSAPQNDLHYTCIFDGEKYIAFDAAEKRAWVSNTWTFPLFTRARTHSSILMPLFFLQPLHMRTYFVAPNWCEVRDIGRWKSFANRFKDSATTEGGVLTFVFPENSLEMRKTAEARKRNDLSIKLSFNPTSLPWPVQVLQLNKDGKTLEAISTEVETIGFGEHGKSITIPKAITYSIFGNPNQPTEKPTETSSIQTTAFEVLDKVDDGLFIFDFNVATVVEDVDNDIAVETK